MNEKIIAALIGVVTGFLGAVLKAWLGSRLKVDDAARLKRWEVYTEIWQMTGVIPKWPRNPELTCTALEEFSKQCRKWYFEVGGIYLSHPARKAYGNMQEIIAKVLSNNPLETNLADGKAYPTEEESADTKSALYGKVQEACSSLRTQLTKDLHSRQRGVLHYVGL